VVVRFLKFATMKYPGASLLAGELCSVWSLGGCNFGAEAKLQAPFLVNAPMGGLDAA
jgi:hypothetical protein